MNLWNAFQVRAHPDSGWWMNSDFPHGGHDGHRIRLPMQNSAEQHERKVHWTLVLQNVSQEPMDVCIYVSLQPDDILMSGSYIIASPWN